MEQTAMQMMYDELIANEYYIPLDLIVKCKELIDIEKQQIIDAHKSGFTEGTCFGATTIYKFQSSKEYYKETFNK